MNSSTPFRSPFSQVFFDRKDPGYHFLGDVDDDDTCICERCIRSGGLKRATLDKI